MSEISVEDILPNYDKLSFMSGAVMAYSDAVGLGVKQLALSSPYTDEELEIMLKVIDYASKRSGTIYQSEPDLIKTKLFRSDIAEGKTVVLIAHNQKILDKYAELKSLKEESNVNGNPEEMENEIAKTFGRLLSYDDNSIEELISKQS